MYLGNHSDILLLNPKWRYLFLKTLLRCILSSLEINMFLLCSPRDDIMWAFLLQTKYFLVVLVQCKGNTLNRSQPPEVHSKKAYPTCSRLIVKHSNHVLGFTAQGPVL